MGERNASSSQSGKSPKDMRWAIVALASIPLIMTLGNSMLLPVLPLMEEELNITKLQSSFIITFYSIVAIIFIPIAGFLSDRFGRKAVILPSLVIAGAGGLIAGIFSVGSDSPYLWILIGRILQGIGVAGAAPVVLPLVGDMFEKDEDVSATLGIVETANTFGKVLSPVLGALLAGFLWYMPFYAIPVFCAISFLLVLFLIKKPKDDKKGNDFKTFLKNTKATFHEHGGWLTATFLIGAILMFLLFGILFYLSTVLEEKYGMHGILKGAVLAIPLAALCLASYLTGKWIKSNGKLMKWIIFTGVVAAGVVTIALYFSKGIVFMMAVFLIAGVGIGAGLPCLDSLVTSNMEKDVRGTITSLLSAMRYVGVAAGPPVVAILLRVDFIWLIVTFAGAAFIAALLTLKFVKPPDPDEQKHHPVPHLH
ncbi:MFS transporter [Terribacillus saccharophilus]|uniref:MFS transporter n=1 Tax=Terribacillus saccharophilus TaxID=361277 RepID=A0A075LHW0_9BACI|nr:MULTISPECIES: MFS transporter [Terribacillus]AIF66004.1 MFS transporter [Terribacillus goriensis]MCM3226761.1 MFS transporter [Terribacillus saccharophilus]SEM91696.1 MFS transporter, ACDE family, multidrug resistance protein [Terribacillus saccharophilus]